MEFSYANLKTLCEKYPDVKITKTDSVKAGNCTSGTDNFAEDNFLSAEVSKFKLSPIVGQWMSQLILTGTKPEDMQHFAFDRFTTGKEIQPRYSSGVLG